LENQKLNNLSVYQNKFAASGFHVFQRAIEESRRRHQNYVSLGHLLIALDAEDGSSFRYLIAKMRAGHGLMADLVPADRAVEKLMEWSPKHEGDGVRIGPETKQFLRSAMKIARSNLREKIEAADLLSAFLQMAPVPYVRPGQGMRL
jgi:ATP-dependent Clp protease ATP-binding subunit ClpA